MNPTSRTPARRRSWIPAITTWVTLLMLVGLPLPAQAAPLPMSNLLPASSGAAAVGRYPVPTGALFVSPTGSNSAAGTQAAPFRTLAHALDRVKSGQTIVLRGGVYREGASGFATGGTLYRSRLNGVTIQSYPGETVWLDGTERVTAWTRVSGTHYSTPWSTPAFCAGAYYTRHYAQQSTSGPCSYPDSIGGRASLGDPQMLFRNGVELKQVGSLAQLTADTFFYDHAARVMHIGFDPAGKTVEVTKHAQALALYAPTNVKILGIGIRRYASNQYSNATSGALLVNLGTNVLLERVSVVNNAGGGVTAWETRNLTIRESVLSYNGSVGFGMNGSQARHLSDASIRNDLLIEHSRFDHNNADAYSVDCSYACGAAGAKVTSLVGATVRYSTFLYNGGMRASGLWFDMYCKDAKVYGNKFMGNARHGLVYEISDGAIIASNIIANNGWGVATHGGGAGLMIGSANVRMWNNTLSNNKLTVLMYDDDRSPLTVAGLGGLAVSQVGPNSVNVDFVNNVITTPTHLTAEMMSITGGRSSVSGNTTSATAIRMIDYNSYAKPASVRFAIWRTNSDKSVRIYATIPALQAGEGSSREAHGHLVNSVQNPFLVNPFGGDYTLRPGSAPVKSGRPLPSDIAALLGVQAGVAVDRGALTLGG